MARRREDYITSAQKPKKAKKKKAAPPKTPLVSIVLLSENYGYRMKSCGPIALVKVGNRTLLEHQLEAIKSSFSNYEIVLCCGFQAEQVISFVQLKCAEHPVRVVENQIHQVTNCCESARLGLNNLSNNKVLICNGELMLDPRQLKKISLDTSCVLSQDTDLDNMDVGIIQQKGRLENISVGLKESIWSEILYLADRRAIASLKTFLASTEYKNKFLFEAISAMCRKHTLSVLDTGFAASKINNAKSLKRITHENLGR